MSSLFIKEFTLFAPIWNEKEIDFFMIEMQQGFTPRMCKTYNSRLIFTSSKEEKKNLRREKEKGQLWFKFTKQKRKEITNDDSSPSFESVQAIN